MSAASFSHVSFDVTRDDALAIQVIVDRAMGVAREARLPVKRSELMMDITAAHANGCPLRLYALSQAEPFDFSHDVFGIHRHIDRTTGRLGGCFVPRYATPESDVAKAEGK